MDACVCVCWYVARPQFVTYGERARPRTLLFRRDTFRSTRKTRDSTKCATWWWCNTHHCLPFFQSQSGGANGKWICEKCRNLLDFLVLSILLQEWALNSIQPRKFRLNLTASWHKTSRHLYLCQVRKCLFKRVSWFQKGRCLRNLFYKYEIFRLKSVKKSSNCTDKNTVRKFL